MGELDTRGEGANLHIAIHLVGLARAADVGLQVHGLSWHSFPRPHCTRSHAHEWPQTSDTAASLSTLSPLFHRAVLACLSLLLSVFVLPLSRPSSSLLPLFFLLLYIYYDAWKIFLQGIQLQETVATTIATKIATITIPTTTTIVGRLTTSEVRGHSCAWLRVQ